MGRIEQVRAYVASGLSMVATKSKAAAVPWTDLQKRPPTDEEIVEWDRLYPGWAIICGAVSCNLEVLDLETDAPIKEFARRVNQRDPDLLPRLPRTETPTGGRHILYRCAVIEGNQKLAADANGKTLIETRGEGGYFLSPLSLAETHPSGKPYKVLAGDLTNIPTITPEQRGVLFSVARSFNEYIEPRKVVGFREIAHGNGFKPGEDFNARPDVYEQVRELLSEHGWSKFGNSGSGEHWSRPGVKDHSSATLFSTGTFYPFSTNALPFNAGEAYSPFAVYALLKHDGDFTAAARALGRQGYGTKGTLKASHGQTPPPRFEPDHNGNNPEIEKPVLKFIRMADVQAKAVEWFWSLYIAFGALTIMEGPPGVGKSTLACVLASGTTRGEGLPGMGKFSPGNVLLCSAEDSKAHVLRPRLDAAGADVTKVFALDEPLTLNVQGRMHFEAAVIEYEPKFILLDPFFAYTGGKVDIHRANEMRDITAWLTTIAEKYHNAIVAVRHLAKSRGYGQALNAGLGSIDLVAAARSVLLVGQDPDDGRKRAMVQIKNNLGPIGPAVGFTLEDGMFYWTGESDITAARILSIGNQEERSAIDEAVEFLREALADEDRETTDVTAEAKRAGISDKTLRNARERLNIRARRSGLPGTKQKFFWSLPANRETTLNQDDEIIAAERA
ncbi:MAG TPA: AAA family ATPase, partial [Pyrinomonadaceae bacterium]|nr:AAA family ATPase [Pyrinomonadaceae bacterium]